MRSIPFGYRVTIGLLIFALLLAEELIRRPSQPRRVKEYPFLFGITAIAMLYGIAHDFVTWSICPGYFVVGKGIPSAATGFTKDVIILAMKATWTPGLLLAAALLVANNRDRLQRQLPYRALLRLAALTLAISMLCEAALGVVFGFYPQPLASALGLHTYYELCGPRFFIVWGMHCGAYAGGLIGLVVAVVLTIRGKRRLGPR